MSLGFFLVCVTSFRSSFDPLYLVVAPAGSFVDVYCRFPCCVMCVKSLPYDSFRLCWVGMFECDRCSDVHPWTTFICIRHTQCASLFQKIVISAWGWFLRLGSDACRAFRGYFLFF